MLMVPLVLLFYPPEIHCPWIGPCFVRVANVVVIAFGSVLVTAEWEEGRAKTWIS